MRVEFDTDGLTTECPKRGFGLVQFHDECDKCRYYQAYDGFTVECGFDLNEQARIADLVEELTLERARDRRPIWSD